MKSLLSRELGSLTESGWRGLGRYGTLWDPHPHLAGRRVVLLVEARHLPVAEVGMPRPTSHLTRLWQESRGVDHLDEEVVGDVVDCLRDVHSYSYGSARGLALIEARDHPSRDGEQGRDGRMPRFEAVLGGASAQHLNNRQEDELFHYLHCRAEQWDGAVGAALLTRLPCLQDRDYDGVLPDCRDIDSSEREVEELCQEGQGMRT